MSADAPDNKRSREETDRILRCQNCGTKLGTYDEQHLDTGALLLPAVREALCKVCGREVKWYGRQKGPGPAPPTG